MGSTIGEGAHSTVKIGTSKKVGVKVAIKIINRNSMSQGQFERCIKEVEILSRVNHMNIIPFIDMHVKDNFMYIVTE